MEMTKLLEWLMPTANTPWSLSRQTPTILRLLPIKLHPWEGICGDGKLCWE
jgi:hypothetical protein